MKKTLFFTALLMGIAVGAQAATITFDFTDDGQATGTDLGTGATTFTDVLSLTATPSGSGSPHLTVKNGGANETGLGIFGQPDNEINAGQIITLHLTTAGAHLTDFALNSVTGLDSALVEYSADGVTYTPYGTITDQSDHTIPSSTATYLRVTGGSSGDELIADVGAVSRVSLVPDGGTTVALLGGALTVLGFVRRKLVA